MVDFTRFIIGGTIAVYVVLVVIVILIRIVVGSFIAKRCDLVLVAKGYDPEDLNLKTMALLISAFLGIVLCYFIMFLYVSSFPTVKATNDLFEFEEEEPQEEQDDPI